MAEEIENEEDLIEEEEEEDVRETDDRQNLDDLTVLSENDDELEEPEGLQRDDDQSDWEEPLASNSLSAIHTGSQPTEAELLANLAPEGETIIEEGEIVRPDEVAGQPLPEIDAPEQEISERELVAEEAPDDQEVPVPDAAGTDNEILDAAPADEPLAEREAEAVPAEEGAPAAAPPPPAAPIIPPTVDSPDPDPEPEPEIEDDPDVAVTAASGDEDSAIPLTIDPAGAEVVVIGNVPPGASLSAGTDNGDGSWTLTAGETGGLTITPPPDSDADFTLSVTADGVTVSLGVTVDAVADAPTAEADDAIGRENTAIDLDLGTALSDTDGSESLSVTISGMPDGATLSSGTNNGDGTWTVDAADIGSLSITPPDGFVGEIPLTLTSVSTEADGGDTATTEVPFTVTVEDAVDTVDAITLEDTSVALSIDVGDADEITISDVPTGAVLSAGIDNEDGTWTLTNEQLDGLTITPPSDSDVDFTLTVSANGTSSELNVTVNADADAPSATAENVSGQEDTAIALDLGTALSDVDGSETLSVTISGMPEGASLSAGTDNGDGTWAVDADDLASLSITPPADFFGEIPLTLTSTSTETDGGDSETTSVPFTVTVADTVDAENVSTLEDSAVALTIDPGEASEVVVGDMPTGASLSAGINNGDGTWTVQAADLDGITITPPADSSDDFTLSITADGFTETMDVAVEAVADTPTVGASDQTGSQNTPIPLDLAAGLTDTDGSETLSIELSGIPDGAVISVGGTEVPVTDGQVTLTGDQLADVSITPVDGFVGDFQLQLKSIATDTDPDSGNTDTATSQTNFTVSVNEQGEFTVGNAVGLEDNAIPLTIDSGGAATVTIENLPDGAMLSAGTENNGVWTINAEDLDGLTVTPPADSDVDFTLSVTADGVSQALNVTVNADADAPTAVANDVTGVEDTAIPLDLTSALTDVDGSESLSITITGMPDGATLSSGVQNDDGSWTVDPADLSGLTFTPPENEFGQFELGLKATSTEADGGDTEITLDPFVVTVESDGDFGVTDASGIEDTAIALDIDVSSLTDTEIVISDVPEGAVFSAGTDNGDGSWTIPTANVPGLTITPPADSDADFDLTVTADGAPEILSVTVAADADAPTASAEDVVGQEDTPIGLNLTSELTDTDGSEVLSVTISDVPPGTTFSLGQSDGGTGWDLGDISPEDLASLTITPPLNFEGDMDLTLNATSTETDGGDFETTNVPFTVTFTPDPNEPNFVVVGAEGDEDTAIPLEIDPGTATEVVISNIPDGAVFSAGTDSGNGTWTVQADDLDGLTITPPPDSDVDFTLSIAATDADGVTAVGNLDVAVHAVADAPDLDVTSSIGLEDSSIPLNISSALNDTDGSETLSMNIDIQGVPEGSVLSAGTDNGDGSWTLTSDDLEGLTITPPDDYYGDMTLQVTSTATESNPSEAGDVSVSSATSSATFGVTVRPVADNPDLNLVDATGTEDTVIALNIGANMADDTTEDLSTLQISGVPDGATLSAGTDLGNGIWSFNSDELAAGVLDELTVTPAEDYNGEFTLTVSAFSTDGGVAVQQMTVDVEAVSDLGIVDQASGTEDTAIALSITAASDETVTITDVPEGAVLSAGTENDDGSWTLTSAELEGLTITPPENSDQDFTLSVASGGETGSIVVAVAAEADVPTLDLTAAAGAEDTAIALEIDPGLTDADGSETLSISIGDIPAGSTLSYVDEGGVTQPITIDGSSATLTTAQLNGLTITPPDNFDGSFDLSVTAAATETDGGSREVTAGTMTVDVAAVADEADVTTSAATGAEDSSIPLSISATGDDDISSITISDVPTGAVLSAGTDNGDGSWTLDPSDLAGLSITPAENSDADFTLNVTATSVDGDDTIVNGPTPLSVSVAADADMPTLDLSNAAGSEDTAIALDIDPGLTDGDGSETLSISIGDIPVGSTLNYVDVGGVTQEVTIDGTTATLNADQLNGLTITPPDNFDSSFDLTVAATSTETDGGDFEVTSGTLTVDVAAVADDAVIDTVAASGSEDAPIALNIAATSDDDITSVVISGVPDGALLSAGTDNGDGTWTLTEGDLTGLTVTPPENSSDEFELGVAVTTTDGTDSTTSTGTLAVNVDGVADTPTLNVFAASGDEDGAIPLQINAGLTDTDGSETLSITISDVPAGAVLNNGSLVSTDPDGTQTWSLDQDDLSGLTITPAADSSTDFSLGVSVTATEDDGDTATTSGTLDVTVDGVADTPTLDLSVPASGTEDTAIPLTINAGVTDASESLSVTIGNIPDGASLSYLDAGGVTQNIDVTDGSVELSPEQLNGLAITPPADSSDDFQLSVIATSSDEGDEATQGGVLDVSVRGDADAPTLDLTAASGDEDGSIPLQINPGLTDTDGSETLSITISDVPAGATLNNGTLVSTDPETGVQTWSLDQDDLNGLTITPAADSSDDFALGVSVTSTEADGDTATTTGTLNVGVDGVADTPTLDLSTPASGTEDSAISLTIDAGLTDASESLSVTIGNIPDGASLSFVDGDGATQTLDITDGTAVLSPEQLNGLTVTPPADSNEDFQLTVTATSTDEGDEATRSGVLDVAVTGVADAPTLTLSDVTGDEDTAIALDIQSTLTDTDGSETLSVTIADVPTGAVLSAGTDNGDGTWTLAPEDLSGLTLTPPQDFGGEINLSVTSTSTENDGDSTSVSDAQRITVTVVDDADEAVITTNDAAGTEDGAIALTIGVEATDDIQSIVITGVPDGATLSSGVNNNDGTWTLEADDLTGLTVTPPADSDADFSLGVTVTTVDGSDTATSSGTLDVVVAADADAPTLDLTTATGDEDTAIALNIDPALTDVDNSESLSITIADVPDGATLSAGVQNNDGTWTLSTGDLDGLTITPAADANGNFDLTISATSTEANGGDTATTTGTLTVEVAAVNDGPVANADALSGSEDEAITFTAADLLSNDTDADGDTLSITSFDQPDSGAIVDNGDGSYTFTPNENWNGQTDFTYTVSDGAGGESQATVTIDVGGVNDGPTAVDDTLSGSEDSPITFSAADLLANDSDSDGGTLEITSFDQPANGEIVDNGDGTYTFTPNEDWSGETNFNYTLSDGQGGTSQASVGITVDGVADAPELTATTEGGDEDTAIALDLSTTSTDADGSETLSITIDQIPDGATLNYVDGSGAAVPITVTGGSASLSPDQLTGLTITPPENSTADMELSITSTSREPNGDEATTTAPLTVGVDAVNDGPVANADTLSGTEDGTITFTAAELLSNDTDIEGDTLSIAGFDQPENGAIVDNGDGSFTFTPDENWNGETDFTYTVSDGEGGTSQATVTIDVEGVNDGPTATDDTLTGSEDAPITFSAADLLANDSDLDGGTLEITGFDQPENGEIVDNGDGTYTFTPNDDWSGETDFNYTISDGQGGTSAATVGITVEGVADNPTIAMADVSGTEDSAITLNIDPSLVDTDGSESLSISIGDIPTGSTLEYVDGNGDTRSISVTDGSAELTTEQLTGLQITPPENFDGSFDLSVSATSTEGDVTGDTATTTGTLTVDVAAEADAATLTLGAASGLEDTAIPLSIGVTADDDISTVTISGVPNGSTLTYEDDLGATQTLTITDNSVNLTPDQLSGLAITPPENSDQDFALTVSATTVDGSDSETVSGTLNVSVDPDADAPTLNIADVTGAEDSAIALNIDPTLVDADGSESLSISVGDIPAGATMSYVDGDGVTQPLTVTNGSVDLTTDQLNGLTITPVDNFDGSFDLSVAATSTEADGGDSATTLGTMTVDVTADADNATLTLVDVTGTEDTAIPLNIEVTADDNIATVTIADVPTGASLSAGTDNGDGTWTLTEAQVDGLTMTPPANSDDDFTLTVSAMTTDGEYSTTVSGTMDVSVAADADAPTLETTTAAGDEDTAIALNIDPGLTDTDGSESLSITIGDIPAGATLNYVDDAGATQSITVDGTTAELTTEQLNGLTITPADNFDGSFDLSVTATSTEATGGDEATTSGTLTVNVDAVADEAVLDLSNVGGTEDQAISLNIGVTADDDIANVTLSDIPSGATLHYVDGNGDTQEITFTGTTAELSTDELNGLTITPPENSDVDFTLGVSATTTDGDDSATVNGTMNVSVAADADAPTLETTTAAGDEDTAIALNIDPGLTDTDGSESLSITIGDVPDGAVLSAGTDNNDGTWTLSAGDLDGLTITPADNFDGSFDLSVTATSTEATGGDEATTSGTLTVNVDAVADEAVLDLSNVGGTEDQAISLNIGVTADDDIANVTLSDIPSGATLNYVDGNGDTQEITFTGTTAELSTDELNGLTITPPENSDVDFTLGVSATTTDGDDSATVNGTMNVSVAADADAPTLETTTAAGDEDTAIALNIDPGLTDTDGSESLSITIGDIPAGATLNYVDDAGATQSITIDGTTAELTTDQLNGLTITPADNFDGSFDLSVTATSTEVNGGDEATTSGTLTVNVDAVADEAVLDLSNVGGTEDQAISLNIGVTADDDIANVTLSDIPSGATLNYVDGNGDPQEISFTGTTAELSTDELNGLTITPPENSDVDFTLGVSATTTDGDDSATVNGTMNVSVAADADAPTLETTTAAGDEDTAIALNIDPGLTDTDGSESLSITIGDVPDGAVLSAGTDNNDGTWTLSAGDLDGLTITPADNFDGSFDLSVTATSTEATGGDEATTSGTLTVNVDAVADEAVLDLSNVGGTEDQAISLNIGVTADDDIASVTISGVPAGAELSAGTDNNDGTWTLSADQVDGLTITPAENSDEDFTLTVSATTTDGDDSATVNGTMNVSVAADADAPTLETTTAAGDEDTAIALNIDPGLTDTDGSESLSITIGDVPDGAVLSAGTDNNDGTWTLSAGDLDGLTITPADNFDGSFDLSVTATSTEATGGDEATTSGTLTVNVDAVADEASLTLGDVSGTEDQAISLNIGVTADDDIASVTISGVPAGAELSAGTDNNDGTWTLSADQVDGLTITPAENSDEDFTLTVSATTTDGDDSATVNGTMDVSVAADADAPTLETTTASGDEDTAIALNIDPGLTDTDGSESLSITIGDVPDGAVLSAGTDNNDGTWTLSAGDLDGLTITPADNFDGSFDLSVTATSTEATGGDEATTSGTLTVNVDAVADEAVLDLSNVGGTEDQAISLNIGVTADDDIANVTLSDIPSGATLNYVDGNGDTQEITFTGTTAELSTDELNGLTITPPENSDVDFTLGVSATTTDGDDSATVNGTMNVSVAADADAPTLETTTAAGDEDTAIALNIDPGLTDTDGSESLSITIGDVPDGAVLSAGTDNNDGTWTLSAGDLDGLTITPADNFDGSFDLSVTATSTEATGGDEATTSDTLTVNVDAVADEAVLDLSNVGGTEDQAISLNIGVTADDDIASVTISGVPAGAELSAGTDNNDGTWTLSADQVDGLTITPAENSDEDFTLTVSATTTDGDDSATVNGTMDVSVAADADAPTLETTTAAGDEDTAIALNIDPGLTDTDGSESLSITIGDVPDGAVLSAGTDNNDGTWTLSAGDLDGLTITPADNFDGSFDLSVTATSTEATGGDEATTSGTLTVNVDAVADEASLTLGDVSGTEDQAISLNIGVTADDDIASVTISGVPAGAELSAGTDNNDGTWTLSADQVDGLTITPAENSDEDFTLTVSATTTDGDDSATVNGTMDVSVAADADAPTLETTTAAGDEDTAIALNIDPGLTDTDGSESLSITIGDIPAGATLNYVDDAGATQSITVDGTTAELTTDQLNGLTITPADNFDGSFDLSVTATSTEATGGDEATTSGTLTVNVDAVADEASLTLGDVSGTEDQAISLNIGVTADDDIASVTISGVPAGAELSAGTDNNDGTWTLSADQVDGLTITPAENSDEDFTLTVSATTTDGDDSATVNGTMDVSVAADADAPTLETTTAAGDEDTAIALNIDPGLTDTDGSESLSITIGDVPDGAVLSAGTDNNDGTWTLSVGDLDGLTITPADNFDGSFDLSVTATSTEATGGDEATTSGTLTVNVDAVADEAVLDLSNVGGTEDQAISLNIGVTADDDIASVTISGVPAGAELSAGTDNNDGTWTLSADQVDGLTITPPENSDVDFTLGVSATTTDGDDSATVNGTMNVSVAADADAPTLETTTAAGDEDTAIALNIDPGLTDTDGSESLSITIGDVPDGAVLSAGTDNNDGTWTLSAGDLDGLTITPADNFDGSFDLSVTATSAEATGGDEATTSGTLTVNVDAVADEASLTLGDVSGTEDQAISLNIGVTADDDIASVTISGVPAGAELSAGTDNNDGTWTLSADQVDGLTITPAENSDEDFTLTVSATTTDGDDSATVNGTMDVSVAADADAPTLETTTAAGDEDTAIALNIDTGLADTDGSETLSITISDVPNGATLSAGVDNNDGTWTLSGNDLDGLTITPAEDYSGSFDLGVTATATEADGGDVATTTGSITVDVTEVDDSVEGSTLDTTDASGNEDTAIALDIDVTQLDTDGSETVSITISDVPDGALLSAGTDNGDGTWTLDTDDLDGLSITPPDDSNVDFQLGVSVTTTEADGGESTTTTATLDVDVVGVADAPTLDVTLGEAETVTTGGSPVDVTISSDNVLASDSGFTVTARTIDNDGNLTEASSDNVSVNPGGPTGFGVLGNASGANTEIGFDSASGQSEELVISFDDDVTSVDVSIAWQHSGESSHYDLYQDGVKVGEGSISGGTDGVDDVGTFTADGGVAFDQIVFTAEGAGDDFLVNSITFEAYEGGTSSVEYPLDITSNLTDTDTSETLSITIDGLPDGASLSAGTENEDGTWTLDADDLDGLTVSTPVDAPAFDLDVSATASENDGDTNTVSTTVSFEATDTSVEGATVDTTSSTGNEDSAIALDIDVTQADTDGSETVSITISDVPDGAVLSAGTDNNDGTWTLDADDLDGLTITPPENSNTDFQLGVSVTTTETNGGASSTTTATLDVDVVGVADEATVSASVEFSEIASSETTVSVPSSITDEASGNTITVSGVPSGATLSAGSDNGDGSWTLSDSDLSGLTVTPADGATDDIDLSFSVVETGAGDTLVSEDFSSSSSGWSGGAAASNGQLVIGGDNYDEAAIKTFDFGDDHAGQTVEISFTSSTFGGWETSGSATDYFNVEANGTEILDTVNVAGSYTFTATLDENGQLELDMSVDATDWREGVKIDNFEISGGDDFTAEVATESVTVTPDAPGIVYDLDITASLADTDSSETLSIDVDNLPDGAVLSAGTENGDGSWTLASGDLANLTVTVPEGTATFDLQVSATSTENDGDTTSVSTSATVTEVDTTVEGATLETTDASGSEDNAIALDIDASLIDTDGSESMSITISDVPAGATLSAGTDNGDGTWTLGQGDLSGLTILPAEDSSADFQLGISVTTTEVGTGDTSTSTATLDVTVEGVADAPELSVTLGDGTETAAGVTPVSYWKLDESGDGNETLVDSVGDNDGTPKNTLKDMDDSGQFGTAAEFNGGGKGDSDDEYIEVDHSADLKPENGSLTLWFNSDDANNGTLASSDSSGYDSGGHFNLSIDDGHLKLRMQDSDSSHTITSSSAGSAGDVSTNEWNQVTVSWGEDGMKMYMNGELVASDDSYTGGLQGNENPWTFGVSQSTSDNDVANHDDLYDYFDGHLDDIAIYDQQLTADQVSDLFDEGVQELIDNGGDSSIEFPLTIAASTTDGSETLSIMVEGLPDDAILSAGTDNGDGTWSLETNDLDGLTVTVPAGSEDFAMTVSATSTDGDDAITATEIVPVDVAGDGFTGDVNGTSGDDTLTGSSGADVIDAGAGNDQIDAGAGDDTVMAGAGNDEIDGGAGDDVIDGGAGNDTIDSGAGDDHIMGGDGDDLFIFGAGDGSDYFDGGNGWSDTVQLEDVGGGPGGDGGWALQVEGDIGYTQTDSGIEFDEEVAGSITLSDGSELTFEGVEKLEW